MVRVADDVYVTFFCVAVCVYIEPVDTETSEFRSCAKVEVAVLGSRP